VRTELKPPGKMNEPNLVRYVKERAYKSSPLYAEDFSTARKAELYDQSEQWLRASHTTRDSRYPTQWLRLDFDANDPNAIPLPVYNEMVALRENESARLGRPEYKPKVRARGENPGITEKEAAEGAERALQHRLKEMWTDQEQQLVYNMPMYGGAWLLSYWDQTWMDTVRVPAKSVVCSRNPKGQPPPQAPTLEPPPTAELNVGPPQQPGIAETMAQMGGAEPPPGLEDTIGVGPPTRPENLEDMDAEAEVDLAAQAVVQAEQALGEGPGAGPEMGPESGMAAPEPEPTCDYVATETMAKQASNFQPGSCPKCGSPLQPYQPNMEEAQGELGKDLPKGDWYMKVLWPYGIFPRDAGIGVDRTDVDEFVYVHPERIDWVVERWPEKVRDPKTGEVQIHPEHPTALMAENPTMGAPMIFRSAENTGVFKDHVLVYEFIKKPWMDWDNKKKRYVRNRGRRTVVVQNKVVLDTTLMIESLNKPGDFVEVCRLEFIPWEPKEGGRRATVGQSLWDRLFDAQDGINERKAQIRAVNQRGALPWYLQQRGRNFETRQADAAIPFRRVMVDIDPNDKQPPLQLMQNTSIDSGVYAEIEQDINYAQRVSGQVEVEQGQVPPGVSAATAIAYLKTEAGEKRRPRIARLREALVRAWRHGIRLMGAMYIEERPYSFEDEFSEERWAFISGDVIAKSNPKVDIYPTPDYDQRDAQRESIRDMVTLGILNPSQTPQLNRKIVKTLEPTVEFFVDDDLQEEQAQREFRDFKERQKVPVIDPSLDDPMTHYQEHGRECFSAWFRNLEAEGDWDGALAILGANWEKTLGAVAMQASMAGQLGNLQSMIYQYWTASLSQAVMAGFQPQNPQALDAVLQWRSHMEAHKLTVLVQQAAPVGQVQAPATGSSPTPESEGEGAGQQGQVAQAGAPEGPAQGAPM